MPLPTPNQGESENDFISRCMGNPTAVADFPDSEQRAGVCFSQWNKKSEGEEKAHHYDGKNRRKKADMNIKKLDEELQIVYAEVYVPNIPDSDNDFMTVETVREMAHSFLAEGRVTKIDVEHSRDEIAAAVVESFIARKGDPDFIEDAWVAGVKIYDPEIWELVKSGEINGFSLDGIGQGRETELEIEIPEIVKGETDIESGHSHVFQVRFDEEGNFLGGQTIDDSDHTHLIKRGTITEIAKDHAHRFSFVEVYVRDEP